MRILAFTLITALSFNAPQTSSAEEENSANEIKKRLGATRGLALNPGRTSNDTTTPVDPKQYVTLPEDMQVNIRIQFDRGSASLRDDQQLKLDEVCAAFEDMSEDRFRIIGHTDATGSDTYNLQLSRLRAEEVRRHLVSRCGISAQRLEFMGVGERELLLPEDPNAGENRRVEFQLLS